MKAKKHNTLTRDWFGNWSNEYDNTLGKTDFHRKLLDLIVGELRPKSGDKVLDIGCGTGLLSLKLLEKAGCSIAAIDNSDEMMSIFKDKIKRLKLDSNITCQFMDADHIKFKKHLFDKAVSSVALHHIKNKQRPLAAVHKILKPGGVFIIGEIDMDTTGSHNDINRLKRILKVLEQEWICAIKNAGLEAFIRMYNNGSKHILNDGEYCISLKQWAAECGKAGFKEVSVKRLPGYKYFGIITAKK